LAESIISSIQLEVNNEKCNKCKREFEAKDELDIFCSQDCKEEALADLDKDSDECLSCQ
jgi:hypothetical protein